MDDLPYHVFIFHPDADTLTVETVDSKEKVADVVSKYSRDFEQPVLDSIEVHVIQGTRLKAAIKSNAVVVEVGDDKFLPGGG